MGSVRVLARRLFQVEATQLKKVRQLPAEFAIHTLLSLVACTPEVPFKKLVVGKSQHRLTKIAARNEMACYLALTHVAIRGPTKDDDCGSRKVSKGRGAAIELMLSKLIELAAKMMETDTLEQATNYSLERYDCEAFLRWWLNVRVFRDDRGGWDVAAKGSLMIPPRA